MRGKVRAIIIIWVCMRDHPRACGEKYTKNDPYTLPLGSPPRMRGKVSAVSLLPFFTGITPAHAGKRSLRSCCSRSPWDHPRACGEKYINDFTENAVVGSPPRMRGKALKKAWATAKSGITPAHAGKRPLFNLLKSTHWDHPRACGEKPMAATTRHVLPGSPPRMRGKGSKCALRILVLGITPAHAGKSS